MNACTSLSTSCVNGQVMHGSNTRRIAFSMRELSATLAPRSSYYRGVGTRNESGIPGLMTRRTHFWQRPNAGGSRSYLQDVTVSKRFQAFEIIDLFEIHPCPTTRLRMYYISTIIRRNSTPRFTSLILEITQQIQPIPGPTIPCSCYLQATCQTAACHTIRTASALVE